MSKNICLKSFEKRNPDTIRFGVISDVHVQDTMFTLDAALDAFNEIGNMDGLLMIGDVVFQDSFEPEPEKYDIVMKLLDEKAHNIPYAFAIGNHDACPIVAFENCRKESLALFEEKVHPIKHHTTIKGYHCITEISIYEPDIAWIENAVKEAVADDADKPVFVMLHDGFRNLILHEGGTPKWSLRLQEILKNYPQVIALVGHIHVTSQSPDIVVQNGFTVVQVPCLGEIGYTAGDGLFGDFFIPGPPQAMMIEIENNIVSVYKLNLDDCEYIGEPAVINIAEMKKGIEQYAFENKEKSNIPYFADDAELKISTDSTSVEIEIPKAYNKPVNDFMHDGFVIGYKAEIFDKSDNNCVFSEIVPSDFYKVNNIEELSAYTYKKISGLEVGKTYEAVVTPISPFRKDGEPIRKEFQTA